MAPERSHFYFQHFRRQPFTCILFARANGQFVMHSGNKKGRHIIDNLF